MDAMTTDSRQLCALAKAGDVAAATELVTLHYQKVYAFLRRFCGSDDAAAELTQKTFMKVWSALGSYEGRASFSTWIHGVARHVYLDWRRRGDRLDSQSDAWWESCTIEGPNPFEDAAEREQAAQLHALLARLDDEKRDVVHLHYYQGLTLKETSAVLGVATSTVKYRLRAALDFLRSQSIDGHTAGKI